MNLEPLASSLEKTCDAFLSDSQEGMPRLIRRRMQPVLDSLKDLVAATGDPVQVQTVFQYPVMNGLRADGKAPANAIAVIGYKFSTDEFVWRVLPVMMTPAGMVFMAVMDSDGHTSRVVSMEDIIELGVTPAEIVQAIRQIAGAVAMDQASSMATQKPADA